MELFQLFAEGPLEGLSGRGSQFSTTVYSSREQEQSLSQKDDSKPLPNRTGWP